MKAMDLKTAEIEAVLKLPGARRYEHFVKRVADRAEGWGLWSEGWALAGSDSGQQVFLFWPAREYAERCTTGPWQGYTPQPIEVHSLLDELLPKLSAANVRAAVFSTPADRGVVVEITRLSADLRSELEKIEY